MASKKKSKRAGKPAAKKRAKPKAVARKAKPAVAKSPVILDEVLEEPLLDVSGILKVKDGVARSRRDVDEDELKQFQDPSLVVESQRKRRGDDDDTDEMRLPSLFADEARRQKARDEDPDDD
jgi:hypothetical protein